MRTIKILFQSRNRGSSLFNLAAVFVSYCAGVERFNLVIEVLLFSTF